MELGGARKNRKKSLFSPMDFFGNLSRSRRSQRGNYSEELKNNFLVQNREISGAKVESWTRKECSSCLNSFLDEISATLALRLAGTTLRAST